MRRGATGTARNAMFPAIGKFGIGAVCAALVGAVSISPAYATSNHSYGKHEYAIVDGGLAPNKRFSVASHGEGDYGYDNFYLYLMAEPRHNKLSRLDGVGPELLDTGPDAYEAKWSADSRHVVVYYRADRHHGVMRLHRIENRRAYWITGPALLDTVVNGAKEKNLSDDGTSQYGGTELTWLSPTRFLLKTERFFPYGTPELARILGRFGQSEPFVGNEDPNMSHPVKFSAEAICELAPGNKYRIVRLKPGRFDQ
jgi:hypothetical protein